MPLSVGSHTISFSYAGDANFKPCVSPGFPVIINPSSPFSADESTVTIAGVTYFRPVVVPWSYSATGFYWFVAPTGSDANPGSQLQPFKTIGRAMSVANPGDVVYVMPGIYAETLNLTKSGTAGNPIILSCAPAAAGGGLGTVTITPPANYVTNPSGGGIDSVIFLEGGGAGNANYVWVNGLQIAGPLGRPGLATSGECGISWRDGSGLGCNATNNIIFNNFHCGLKEWEQGATGAGIDIEGNVIYGNGGTTLDHGIYMPSNNVVINGNIAFNNTGFGIQSYTSPTGQTITNNLIFNNPTGGIVLGGPTNLVRHNTVVYNVVSPSVPTSDGYGLYFSSLAADQNTIKDNIFCFNTFDEHGSWAPDLNPSDYNCYFPTGLDPQFNGGPGPHDIFVDPKLGPDYRLLAGSPCIGTASDGSNMGAF